MDEKVIGKLKEVFDDVIHRSDDGEIEFWYARELHRCWDIQDGRILS